MGIAIDVTGTGDVPEVKTKLAVTLGKGAAIKIMDRSVICTPSVVELMERLAAENGIPTQREVLPFGGTDASAMQTSRGGIPVCTVSIPCRYVHSACEVIDMRDMDAALKLLTTYLTR